MTKYVYDEEASAVWHMDVVHEVDDDDPSPVSRWAEGMRRLNSVRDPLARKIVALHSECGSGDGPCDDQTGDSVLPDPWSWWACETLELIAEHHRVEYPPRPHA